MSDEIGITGKLNRLLPADQTKDSGGKVPGQDVFSRKRKKKQEENVSPVMDQEGKILEDEKESSSGKIVDVVI